MLILLGFQLVLEVIRYSPHFLSLYCQCLHIVVACFNNLLHPGVVLLIPLHFDECFCQNILQSDHLLCRYGVFVHCLADI